MILVTGGSGLLGTALKKVLPDAVYPTSKECNYSYMSWTSRYFYTRNPDTIIHCAAKVGGLLFHTANNQSTYSTNRVIDANIVEMAFRKEVKTFISILSTCVFPVGATYPLRYPSIDEDSPHPSNYGYSYAKRLLAYQVNNIKNATGWNWFNLVPCNMYGIQDQFNLQQGHVIPSLIHKAYLAKRDDTDFVVAGDGSPLRQFLFADDMAHIIQWATEQNNLPNLITVNEKEHSIKYVATLIADRFGVTERMIFDTTQPNGIHRKPAKNDIAWFKFTPLEEGLNKTIDWFIANFETVRK